MKFLRMNEKTDTSAIRELEAALGIELPNGYVEFLLAYNGGVPDPSNRYIDIPDWNELLVSEIYGISGIAEHSVATDRFSNFSSVIAKRMLAICHDPFSETIFMDLRPRTYGKIYVRAHAYPPTDPLNIDDTGFEQADYEEASLYYPIAGSFEEFIDMLGPEPD